MNLGKNVYNLLKRQSEVYVLGLGTFKRNHTPSTFDEKRNVFLPPIDYIDFESNSKTGYDFTSYVQQLDEIDRSEAVNQVESTVQKLLVQVRDQGQVKLDDLGYLVSYGEGYVFKALDLSRFNYEPVEAAVKPVSEEVMEREDPSIPEENIVPPIEENNDKASLEEVSNEQIEDSDPNVEEELTASSSNKIWYVLLAVVALGILAALYYRNKDMPTTNRSQDSAAVSGKLDERLLVEDTLKTTGPVDSLNQVDTAKNALSVLIPENHSWQIVIGSHKTLAQAYEQAESYNKAGYPKVRVVPSNLAKNRKKVIWDSYETKEQVDSALTYVQRHIIKDAWPDKINR